MIALTVGITLISITALAVFILMCAAWNDDLDEAVFYTGLVLLLAAALIALGIGFRDVYDSEPEVKKPVPVTAEKP